MSNTVQMMQDESDAISAPAARDLTDKIRAGLAGIYQLIIEAYQGRAWVALGYGSWDEYVQREFGNQPLRPPLEDRTEIIQSMRDAGMSTRAIVTGTQTSKGTVERALKASGAPFGAPEESEETSTIVGLDGKEYSPNKTLSASRGQQTDSAALDAVLDAPAETAGVKVLDTTMMGEQRSNHAEKILAEFHGSDVAVLQKTMFLVEKVGSLVSPVSGEISVDKSAYSHVAKDIAAAIRQFAYVARTLSAAQIEFENQQLLEVVIEDVKYATEYLSTTMSELEEKQ